MSRTKIPLFIIVHNQYEILKKSVESYEKFIEYPIEIIFHNVASTYWECLNYLKEKKEQGYKVYESKVNNHHTVVSSVRHYISEHPECEYIIMTDADVQLHNVNRNIIDFYIYVLNKLGKTSIGPMLEIHNIPDEYWNKQKAIKGHTQQFWNKSPKSIQFNGDTYKYIDCNTDTTFQLYSSKRMPRSFPHGNSIRVLSPYSALHLDWYVYANNITPCQLYYLNNTTKISHWNNKTFDRNVHRLFNNFNKNKHIYYHNSQSIDLKYNFGNYITEFIYEILFLEKPILDISGGSENKDVIFGSGSILNKSQTNSIIWGSGFLSEDQIIPKPSKILSVRGPLTRECLLKQGHECNDMYGDIALILPYFYNPDIKKAHKLGIIPRYDEIEKVKDLCKTNDSDIILIDTTTSVKNVIDNILKCEMTISSSLYGLIVSHAYNIKSMWISIDQNTQNNFKFRDYYGSVNVTDYHNLLPHIYDNTVSLKHIEEIVNNYPSPIFPINTKNIIEACPFINIKKSI